MENGPNDFCHHWFWCCESLWMALIRCLQMSWYVNRWVIPDGIIVLLLWIIYTLCSAAAAAVVAQILHIIVFFWSVIFLLRWCCVSGSVGLHVPWDQRINASAACQLCVIGTISGLISTFCCCYCELLPPPVCCFTVTACFCFFMWISSNTQQCKGACVSLC